jgi:hypothetical protein
MIRLRKEERLPISRIFTIVIVVAALIVASLATVETLRLRPSTNARTTSNNSTSMQSSSASYSTSSSAATSSPTTITSTTSSSFTSTTTSASFSISSSLCNAPNNSYTGQSWVYDPNPNYGDLGTVVVNPGESVTLYLLVQNLTEQAVNNPVVGQTVCFTVYTKYMAMHLKQLHYNGYSGLNANLAPVSDLCF